jgi:hypothetical protein
VAPGTHPVQYSLSATGCAATGTAWLTVYPAPAAPLVTAGAQGWEATPGAVGPGNNGLSFDWLSADPEGVPTPLGVTRPRRPPPPPPAGGQRRCGGRGAIWPPPCCQPGPRGRPHRLCDLFMPAPAAVCLMSHWHPQSLLKRWGVRGCLLRRRLLGGVRAARLSVASGCLPFASARFMVVAGCCFQEQPVDAWTR